MQTIGTRIRKRRKSLKLTQVELAKAIGVSGPSVTQWEKDDSMPKSDNARALCEVLKTNWEWVRYGKGSPDDIEQPLVPNTIKAENKGLCPVISTVQAGEFSEAVDIYEPGYADEWMPCPVKHGPNTFILQVEGESMFNPNGPKSFRAGDYIFVDPTKEAVSGSLVVVRQEHEKTATFKQLILDAGKCYLKALNPAWPNQILEINTEAQVIGVVICKLEKL